jgi:hypothetical protein
VLVPPVEDVEELRVAASAPALVPAEGAEELWGVASAPGGGAAGVEYLGAPPSPGMAEAPVVEAPSWAVAGAPSTGLVGEESGASSWATAAAVRAPSALAEETLRAGGAPELGVPFAPVAGELVPAVARPVEAPAVSLPVVPASSLPVVPATSSPAAVAPGSAVASVGVEPVGVGAEGADGAKPAVVLAPTGSGVARCPG